MAPDTHPQAPFVRSPTARGESTNGRAHGYCEASARREEEGDVCAYRRRRATPRSPAFWAVQSSPNGRWQSPARPMRPSGCGGGGPSASLRRLDDVHRHRLRRRALHTAPRRSQRGHLYFHHGLLRQGAGIMSFSARDSFTHLTSNGYVHAYRRGPVVALYNPLNLNAAFLLDVPEGAAPPSRLPHPAAEALEQLGPDLAAGWA